MGVTRSRRRFRNIWAGGHGAGLERRCRDRGQLCDYNFVRDRAGPGLFCDLATIMYGQYSALLEQYRNIWVDAPLS